MILDEFILLKISKPNVRFYKEKYFCKVGDLISISVDDLTHGSNELVLVKCDVCQKEKKSMFRKCSLVKI